MTNKKKINQESQLIFSMTNPNPFKKTMAALEGGHLFVHLTKLHSCRAWLTK